MFGPLLVIEDNPGDLRLITEQLQIGASEGQGNTEKLIIFEAENLSDGLRQVKNCQFATILLDPGLPDSQGIETFLAVKDAAPDTAVVIISGLDDDVLAKECVQKGAQDYVVKGTFNPESLVKTVDYAQRRQRHHSSLATQRLLEDIRTIVKDTRRILQNIPKDRLPPQEESS